MPSTDQITPGSDLLVLTANIVSAHTAKNPVPSDKLPDLIREVHRTLSTLQTRPSASSEPTDENRTTKQKPAVPAAKSVFPSYIICLEDGKKLKMLKRHLQTAYGMTPEQYRHKWGLPPSYPMTAPEYAATRSSLAKSSGLGQRKEGEATPPRKAGRKAAAAA